MRRSVVLPWDEEDWRGLDDVAQRERWKEWLDADLLRGFDLTRAPLLRLAVRRLGETRFYFAWDIHHVLCDGWSLAWLGLAGGAGGALGPWTGGLLADSFGPVTIPIFAIIGLLLLIGSIYGWSFEEP